MANLTRQDFMEKYGHIPEEFSDFYDYTFRYINITTRQLSGYLEIEVGGNPDAIRDHFLNSDEQLLLSQISPPPFSGTVRDTHQNIVDEFYDY